MAWPSASHLRRFRLPRSCAEGSSPALQRTTPGAWPGPRLRLRFGQTRTWKDPKDVRFFQFLPFASECVCTLPCFFAEVLSFLKVCFFFFRRQATHGRIPRFVWFRSLEYSTNPPFPLGLGEMDGLPWTRSRSGVEREQLGNSHRDSCYVLFNLA